MQKLWYQTVIKDVDKLSGESTHNLITTLISTCQVKYITVADVIGANVQGLKSKDGDVTQFELKEALDLIKEVIQFDWCDFFFFSESPYSIDSSMTYPEVIKQSILTLRAVDDTYFYIYSQYNIEATLLEQGFQISERKAGIIEELDFPE